MDITSILSLQARSRHNALGALQVLRSQRAATPPVVFPTPRPSTAARPPPTPAAP